MTEAAGGAAIGPNGAGAAGAFNTQGPNGGDARGAGGFHYNADTGTLNRGGVVQVNDNVYAGRDGNVYKHDENGWTQVHRPDRSRNLSGQTRQNVDPAALDGDRFARERGDQRVRGDGGSLNPGAFQRQGGAMERTGGFERGGGMQRPAGGMQRPVGGFRPGLGGGGFRGGGFRRR